MLGALGASAGCMLGGLGQGAQLGRLGARWGLQPGTSMLLGICLAAGQVMLVHMMMGWLAGWLALVGGSFCDACLSQSTGAVHCAQHLKHPPATHYLPSPPAPLPASACSGMQDLFGMLQSPTFCYHLGYGCLEVALGHLFPELRPLFRTLQHGGLG